VIGSSRDARLAGSTPNTRPMLPDRPTVINTLVAPIAAGSGVKAATAATAALAAAAFAVATFALRCGGAFFVIFVAGSLRAAVGLHEFLFFLDFFFVFRFRLAGRHESGLDADGGIARPLGRVALLGALQLEGAGGQAILGIEEYFHAMLGLDAAELVALLVQHIDRHIIGDAHGNGGGAVLLGFLFQAAQHAQGGGFDRAHQADARAMRAGDGRTGDHAGAQACGCEGELDGLKPRR
jgi:hypothetical protein